MDMESDNKSKLFWIGLFVSGGIVLFLSAIFYLTDDSIDTEYKFSVIFENGMGVQSGSDVKMIGQQIGQVSNVRILDGRNGVVVELSINDKLAIMIPNNSTFQVKASIFGETHVQINPGDGTNYIETGELVTGEIPTEAYDIDPVVKDLSAFSRQLSSTLTDTEVRALQSIISNTDSLVAEVKNSLMVSQEINRIVTNLEIFSIELKSMSTTLGEGFKPKIDKIDSILSKLDKFSNKLEPASKGLESFEKSMSTLQMIVQDLDQGKGSIGKLLKDEALYDNLNEVVDNTNELINDLKENPAKYVKAYWQGRK
jgi:phospholipid/cholesterol/gamma-HCH transport system substrate-binding protein